MRLQGWIFAANDLQDKCTLVVGVKGVLERTELVQDATQRPDIRLVIVGFILAQLWAQIVRRAYDGLGVTVAAQNPSHTQITYLDMVVLVQEEIHGF